MSREAKGLGLRSKKRVFSTGRVQGGGPLSRGQIYHLLRNPTYRGLTRHKEKTWPGKHDAIIDEDLFARVQEKLAEASGRPRTRTTGAETRQCETSAASLMGKLRNETGDRLTPTHTKRHGRRLRYYVSNRLISGGADPSGWRLPAPAFEREVAKAVARHLAQSVAQHRLLIVPELRGSEVLKTKTQDLLKALSAGETALLQDLIRHGQLK